MQMFGIHGHTFTHYCRYLFGTSLSPCSFLCIVSDLFNPGLKMYVLATYTQDNALMTPYTKENNSNFLTSIQSNVCSITQRPSVILQSASRFKSKIPSKKSRQAALREGI
jgi:hypothetical protein